MVMELSANAAGQDGQQRPLNDQEWEKRAKAARYRARDVAKSFGISLRTLQRHFQERYGLKVSNWLTALRMQEAYRRVAEGEMVKSVAIELGYKQLSHFSRDFKRYYGVPPTYLQSGKKSWGKPPTSPPQLPRLRRPRILRPNLTQRCSLALPKSWAMMRGSGNPRAVKAITQLDESTFNS
jgi:AraC-like DNA-binding protein